MRLKSWKVPFYLRRATTRSGTVDRTQWRTIQSVAARNRQPLRGEQGPRLVRSRATGRAPGGACRRAPPSVRSTPAKAQPRRGASCAARPLQHNVAFGQAAPFTTLRFVPWGGPALRRALRVGRIERYVLGAPARRPSQLVRLEGASSGQRYGVRAGAPWRPRVRPRFAVSQYEHTTYVLEIT